MASQPGWIAKKRSGGSLGSAVKGKGKANPKKMKKKGIKKILDKPVTRQSVKPGKIGKIKG